jgi:protein-S-isoprenylcysteine O-methyltransferase Ste14
METRPPDKRLKLAPFAIHATRGLLRDQTSRRRTMAISIAVAVILLVAGLTVLRPWLDPHEHPWRFILFWLACAWETVLGILLALFDLLLMRAQERAARKALREQIAARSGTGPDEN